MALPSNIPTSFVPHPATTSRRFHTDLIGVFGFLTYVALGIVISLAIGVFFYDRVLVTKLEERNMELARAEAGIDSMTVKSFVRLRDRLISGKKLLDNHVALSGFFSLLETVVPSTIRFVSISLSADDLGVVSLDGVGVAKSFNALAVASAAFAKDGRIKNAIFSNIAVSPKDSTVSFDLSASLDPQLVTFSTNARSDSQSFSASAVPVASTTKATTTQKTP